MQARREAQARQRAALRKGAAVDERRIGDMYSPNRFSRHFAFGLFLCSIVGLSSGCVASRKFVRGEVHTTADQLNAKIEKTDGNVKEINDRVGNLDARTNEHGRRLDSLN